MSSVDRKDSHRRRNASAAVLVILIVSALSVALAPLFGAGLMIRTAAAAEFPAMGNMINRLIAPDKITIGGGETGGTEDNGNNPPVNNGDNNNPDNTNNNTATNTDNSWCYNQGTVTDADGNTKQITSCWSSEQECNDMHMVDAEATGDCFLNPNAHPDESTHNSWCYDAGPDPVEDKSCWNSQQECEQARMNNADATTECSRVAPPLTQQDQ